MEPCHNLWKYDFQKNKERWMPLALKKCENFPVNQILKWNLKNVCAACSSKPISFISHSNLWWLLLHSLASYFLKLLIKLRRTKNNTCKISVQYFNWNVGWDYKWPRGNNLWIPFYFWFTVAFINIHRQSTAWKNFTFKSCYTWHYTAVIYSIS